MAQGISILWSSLSELKQEARVCLVDLSWDHQEGNPRTEVLHCSMQVQKGLQNTSIIWGLQVNVSE